jgi:hypothetical protein
MWGSCFFRMEDIVWIDTPSVFFRATYKSHKKLRDAKRQVFAERGLLGALPLGELSKNCAK